MNQLWAFVMLLGQLLWCSTALCQEKIIDRSADSQPDWIFNTPSGVKNNYYVGRGESTESVEKAKDLAEGVVANAIGEESKIEGLEQEKVYYEVWEVTSYERRYVFWVLASIPKDNPDMMPNRYLSLVKSMIVPGWGQYSKNQPRKAFLIFSLEMLSISGALITNELSKNAHENARNTRTQELRDWYQERSDTYYKLSFTIWLVAASTHIWGSVDALVSQPTNFYVNEERYSITPLISFYKEKLMVGVEIAL